MADEVTMDFIAKQIERVLDEQRAMRTEQAAMRTELRRMAENQMMTARSIQGLRDVLELMIEIQLEHDDDDDAAWWEIFKAQFDFVDGPTSARERLREIRKRRSIDAVPTKAPE